MADAGGSGGDVVGKSVLEVGADGSNFDAAIAGMTRKATDFERAAVGAAGKADAAISGIGKGGAAGAQQLDRATRSIIGSVERAIATLKAGERGSADFYEALAAQRGAKADVLRPYIEQLRALQAAQEAVKNSASAGPNKMATQLGEIAGATRDARVQANLAKNAFRQLPAQFTDIFTSLQGGQNPFTVLIQQGGQIKDSFGGVGNAARALMTYIGPVRLAIGGVGAALGVVGLAAHKGSEELLAYERSLILSGNAAGTTVSRLNEMAKSISASVGTQGKAAEVLTALAAGGNVGGAAFDKMAEAAIRLERVGGPAALKTVEQFNELAKGPLQATIKLNEGVNFLTRSLYDEIKALEDQGRAAEAARVAQDAYAETILRRTADLESSLGTLQRAWRGMTDVAKAAWDAMLDVGRPDTLQERLAKAKRVLEDLRPGVQLSPEFGGSSESANQAEVNRAQALVDSLEEQLRLKGRTATIDGERAAQGKAQAEAGKLIEQSLTRQQRLTQELAKAGQVLRDAGRLDQLPAVEAAIRKKFAEPASAEKRDVFGPMLRDIEDLIRANERRIDGARELTKAEELEIRLTNKLADSLKDLKAPQQDVLRAAIERAVASQRTRDAQVEEQKAAEVALKAAEKEAAARAAARKKEDDGIADFIAKQREEANARVKSIQDRITGLKDENAALTISRAKNIELAAAIELVAIARLEEKLAAAHDGSEESERLTREIAARKELANTITQTAIPKELDAFLDPNRAKNFGDALTDAFDGAGNSLARLSNLFSDYAQKQTEIQDKMAKADQIEDPVQRLQYQNRLIQKQGELQLDTYASMAGAAKGFFNEHSRGYKALHAAETTFRAFQLASNLVKGVSAAAVGVASQAQGDPYTAFPRMAAMAAAMAALGFATGFLGKSGGGAQATAEQRQSGAATGRIVTADQASANSVTVVLGTVLGDGDAKSESIAKALETLKDTAKIELSYSRGALNALESIRDSMAGLASVVARSAGITTGKNLGILESTTPYTDKIGIAVPNLIGDKLTSAALTAFDKVLGPLWGKVKTGIVDSGLSILGNINDVIVQQYADVSTTKSSFFGLVKKTTEDTVNGPVESHVADQFSLIFKSIGDTLTDTAAFLGRDGDEFQNALNSFVIDLPRLSFKDLKGDELTEAISAAIGGVADDLALNALPGLNDFQKVGEGYFETLVRVASGIESANYQMELLGIAAIDYTAVIRKQSDVSAEIVRQSIQGAETVSGVMSSVGILIDGVGGSADDIVETYKSLIDVRDVLGSIGISSDSLTVSLLRGAGGLDALNDSAKSYLENFFSDAERTASATALLKREFAALGLALPGTRDDFRALVDVIAKDTTDSGQKLLGKVLGLADAFNDVADAASKAADLAIRAAEDLAKAIDSNIGKFQTPAQQVQYGYLQASLKLADVGLDAPAQALASVSLAQVAEFVQAFVGLSDVSTEAKIAVVEVAGALADLAGRANELQRNAIQSQLDAITEQYGDVTAAIAGPTELLADAFTRGAQEIKSLQDSLDDMLGTVGKTVQQVLASMLEEQKSLQAYRSGSLADAIDAARLSTLTPEGRIGALRAREATLFGQLGSAADPVSIAQKLQAVIVDRLKEEADLSTKVYTDQITSLERLRDLSAEIAQFTGSLRFSDLSPLSFADQLASAQSLFDQTLAGAQAGDATAQANLTGNARAYLDEARAYFASSADYAAIFAQVTGSLDALGLSGANVDPQITALQALQATVSDGSTEQLAALLSIDTALSAREDRNAAAITQQIALAQAQIDALKAVNEAQGDQIRQQAAIYAGLVEQLRLLNVAMNQQVVETSLAGAAP